MPSLIPMPYASEYGEWVRTYPNGGAQSAWTYAIRFMESKFSSDNTTNTAICPCHQSGLRCMLFQDAKKYDWFCDAEPCGLNAKQR